MAWVMVRMPRLIPLLLIGVLSEEAGRYALALAPLSAADSVLQIQPSSKCSRTISAPPRPLEMWQVRLLEAPAPDQAKSLADGAEPEPEG